MKLAAIILMGVSLAGCNGADLQSIEKDWAALPPAQKVQIATTFVNGVCVATALVGADMYAINAINNPQFASGGKGASTAGTAQKISAIGQLPCQNMNGMSATLNTKSASVTLSQ